MKLFDVELPLIQAPMAGVQDHRLAAAVCNAGGLGSLPAAQFSSSDLRRELSSLCAATDKPFNVNFFSHTNPPADSDRERRWLETLTPYYLELGIDPASITPAAGRMPFDHDVADVVEAFRPPVVSFLSDCRRPISSRGCADGDRRSSLPRRPSMKRAGSRRTASTPSSRRAERQEGTEECS